MKTAHRISLILIAIPLVVALWSSLSMIVYVQPERSEIAAAERSDFRTSYARDVHEAGFARLALAVIGLLVLFIPYRKGERWAFAALALLVVCYGLPVFFFKSIPNLGRWQIFRNLPEPRAMALAPLNFYYDFFTILAFAGLALALPRFARGSKTPQV